MSILWSYSLRARVFGCDVTKHFLAAPIRDSLATGGKFTLQVRLLVLFCFSLYEGKHSCLLFNFIGLRVSMRIYAYSQTYNTAV